MQRDLGDPILAIPHPLPVLPWTPETAPAFYTAYTTSFATRPGFRPPPAEEWISGYANDPEFRPDLSLVASVGRMPVAFLTAGVRLLGDLTQTAGWVWQVGVAPPWRGRGISAAFIVALMEASRQEGFWPSACM